MRRQFTRLFMPATTIVLACALAMAQKTAEGGAQEPHTIQATEVAHPTGLKLAPDWPSRCGSQLVFAATDAEGNQTPLWLHNGTLERLKTSDDRAFSAREVWLSRDSDAEIIFGRNEGDTNWTCYSLSAGSLKELCAHPLYFDDPEVHKDSYTTDYGHPRLQLLNGQPWLFEIDTYVVGEDARYRAFLLQDKKWVRLVDEAGKPVNNILKVGVYPNGTVWAEGDSRDGSLPWMLIKGAVARQDAIESGKLDGFALVVPMRIPGPELYQFFREPAGESDQAAACRLAVKTDNTYRWLTAGASALIEAEDFSVIWLGGEKLLLLGVHRSSNVDKLTGAWMIESGVARAIDLPEDTGNWDFDSYHEYYGPTQGYTRRNYASVPPLLMRTGKASKTKYGYLGLANDEFRWVLNSDGAPFKAHRKDHTSTISLGSVVISENCIHLFMGDIAVLVPTNDYEGLQDLPFPFASNVIAVQEAQNVVIAYRTTKGNAITVRSMDGSMHQVLLPEALAELATYYAVYEGRVVAFAPDWNQENDSTLQLASALLPVAERKSPD